MLVSEKKCCNQHLCNSIIAISLNSIQSSNSKHSTLLLTAAPWWHQVDKGGNISCKKFSLEFCLVLLRLFSCFAFLFRLLSICVCDLIHKRWDSLVSYLFSEQPAGCDRVGLPNSSLYIWVQDAQPDETCLFTPVTYLSLFFFSTCIPFHFPILSSLSPHCFFPAIHFLLWHWTIQICFCL